MHRTHTCGEINGELVGKRVVVAGWVVSLREIGKLNFVVLRDRYGDVQVVFEGKRPNVALGYVLKVEGEVRKRPTEEVNPKMKSGDVEIYALNWEVLNTTKPLPFLPEDKIDVHEDTRLRHRVIDLRRPKMQRNIILRHEIILFIRNYMANLGFIEMETPILTKSTPEGARDFLVPSRLHKGKFYALPQSPQLYKQVLMAAGFDKYFQIARCFRDEDLRADRQYEFTQLDVEMSFVSEIYDVIKTVEPLVVEVFNRFGNADLKSPLPVITYLDSMEKYGSDKPDLRYDVEYEDWTERVKGRGIRVFESIIESGGKVKVLRVPSNIPRSRIDKLLEDFRFMYAKIENGKASGNFSKFLNEEEIRENDGKTLFVFAGKGLEFLEGLGDFRNIICKEFLEKKRHWAGLWVVDFPLFYWNKEENVIEPAHHIFTSPYEEDLQLLERVENAIKTGSTEELEELTLKIRGKQYDLVINGVELGSGSIRVHNADLQRRLLRIIGLKDEDINERFGFLMYSLEMGAPPHGGIALGIDRMVAMCAGEESIREVILFPKSANGVALFENAPSEVSEEQLKELGICVKT
ncbi:MAG: aspartate--tRNA ligase [candidate division WOR-3 bacterium]